MESEEVCSIISSIEEIEKIAHEWGGLHRQCGEPLFAGPDWFFLWWNTLGKSSGWKPFLVMARRNGVLTGALALAVRSFGCIRILEWAGGDAFDYRDAVAAEPETVGALWEFARNSGEFDVLCIRDVRPDSPSLSLLSSFARCARVRRAYSASLNFKNETDWMNSRSKNFRRSLKRRKKRLENAGQVQIDITQGGNSLVNTIASLVEQKQEWCRKRGMKGIFRHEKIHDYFLNLAEIMERQGRLFLMTVSCNGTPISHKMGFIHRSVMYNYVTTYDEDWARFSPGLLCMAESIKWSIRAGVTKYDFMRGDEIYKQAFADEAVLLSDFLYGKTLKGKIYVSVVGPLWKAIDCLRSSGFLRRAVARLRSALAISQRANRYGAEE